VGKKR